MSNRNISILDRWETDAEDYEKNPSSWVSYPQCEACAFHVVGNALHCKVYEEEEKPRDVMFISKECPKFRAADETDFRCENLQEERILGGLLGFCVADALGVPVEFKTREEIKQDEVRELRAYGTHFQPFGSWSDDTSLMLCLVDVINHGYSSDKLRENMIAYYDEASFTPSGKVFDIGNTTRDAIMRMKEGLPDDQCGSVSVYDNGNGALMRVLPLAFMDDLDTESLVKMTVDVSGLTHRHPRSVLGCVFYVLLANKLYNGFGREQAYDEAVRLTKDYGSIWSREFREYKAVLDKSIIEYDEDQIRSSGYVVESLEAALWSFYRTDSYKEAVLKAVNLGGDTDTIGAITGGLAGIYYGISQIDERWLQTILRKKEINEMARKFAKDRMKGKF